MAPRTNHIDQDFNDLLDFLATNKLVKATFIKEQKALVRKTHQYVYSLMWWKFQINPKEYHKKVFLHEMASDSIQIIPQSLMGYFKTSSLLIRGVVECLLKHIYYSDHPVEYELLQLNDSNYTPVRQMFDYLYKHPLFIATEEKFDAINRLKVLYGDLSSTVHGVKIKNLQMKTGLASIRPEKNILVDIVALLKKCIESINFILIIYHRNYFNKLHLHDREVLLRALPKKAKQIISGAI